MKRNMVFIHFLGIFHERNQHQPLPSYPLVNVYIAMERSTILNGKINELSIGPWLQ